MNFNINEFVLNSFYSIYGFFVMLLRFEFYIQFSKQYQKYIDAQIAKNRLNVKIKQKNALLNFSQKGFRRDIYRSRKAKKRLAYN